MLRSDRRSSAASVRAALPAHRGLMGSGTVWLYMEKTRGVSRVECAKSCSCHGPVGARVSETLRRALMRSADARGISDEAGASTYAGVSCGASFSACSGRDRACVAAYDDVRGPS